MAKIPDRNGANTAHLRADIDAGRTRDKAEGLDPSAAPLGTDAEAGGARTPPSLVDSLRDQESRPKIASGSNRNAVNPSRAPSGGPSGGIGTAGVLWLFLLGVFAILAFGFGLNVSLR